MTIQPLTADWVSQFDQHLKALFAIDHNDAGMDDGDLRLFSDLPPRDAALAFGEEFGLDRVDQGWGA